MNSENIKRSLRFALFAWMAFAILVPASAVVIYLRNGMEGINLFIQQWPLSNLAVTLESVVLTWLCFGAILFLIYKNKINSSNLIFVSGFFLVILVYLNILRERFRYGDYQYYLEAATAIYNNQPLPDTYLYLPLWATLLQFIAPLGDTGMLAILWFVNILALGAFYILLVQVLETYGFENRLASIIVIAFMLVNAPLQRTLGYVQVNLLTMCLIMISLLIFRKNDFLSALTLALAIHLKTSPAALVLAFLLERNWKWILWFGLSFIGIALILLALEGPQPYLDYITNIGILSRITDTNFHDTSFDSFFRFLNPFFGIQIEATRIISLITKAAFGISTIYVMARNIKFQIFAEGENKNLRNALPALFIIMTLTSPIVWDHHGLFLALAFLLLLKVIETPSLWLWFAFAYYLEFIQPSFDFFPWSYGRLIAPLIALTLMWFVTYKKQIPNFFATSNRWFTSLSK